MNYKLVCWNDISIPVKKCFNWIAWDKNGDVYVYTECPIQFDDMFIDDYGASRKIFDESLGIAAPDAGEWHEQLYWIGG